jgi:broad specificity phosphatase PhoE
VNLNDFPQSFFYMRHAQTDAHIQKVICGGGWDLPLNNDGLKQVKDAAANYANVLSGVRNIFCSPLLRAKQTAEVFAHKLQVPVTTDEDLKEWILGDWDRQPYDSVPDLFHRKDDPPAGEKRVDFERRIQKSLISMNRVSGPILIISHGAVWFSLMKILGIEPRHIPCAVPSYFERLAGRFGLKEVS